MSFLNHSLFPTCSCGATVEDKTTHAKHNYSIIGWFFWTMGTTAIPTKIEFSCDKCQKTFLTLKDKEKIVHFITYKKY